MPPVLRLLENGRIIVDILDVDDHLDRRGFTFEYNFKLNYFHSNEMMKSPPPSVAVYVSV